MKADIRLISLDMDDTLLNRQKEIPEINCLALRECERRGIRIVLNSGRSFELMRQFARQLGVDAFFVSVNGARIDAGRNGPTLAEFCFERAVAERVCREMEKSGMYFNVYRRGKCYMGNPEVLPSLGERFFHHVPGFSGEADYPYETIDSRERLWGEGMDGVYKFVLVGEAYDPRFDVMERKLADMHLSAASAWPRNREFMPTGVDKGSAVRFLCEHLKIAPEQVMAFGDQTNDIPMLRASGWPVAMENAEDAVKQAARIIAPDCDLGGVGRVLEEYVL